MDVYDAWQCVLKGVKQGGGICCSCCNQEVSLSGCGFPMQVVQLDFSKCDDIRFVLFFSYKYGYLFFLSNMDKFMTPDLLRAARCCVSILLVDRPV